MIQVLFICVNLLYGFGEKKKKKKTVKTPASLKRESAFCQLSCRMQVSAIIRAGSSNMYLLKSFSLPVNLPVTLKRIFN